MTEHLEATIEDRLRNLTAEGSGSYPWYEEPKVTVHINESPYTPKQLWITTTHTAYPGNFHRIYVIGSLRNPAIPEFANALRELGHEVHDDWYSPGPEADERWQEYEQRRGRTYAEALSGRHATMVFEEDKRWLEWADVVVLLLPAGRSGHMELAWCAGRGQETHIVLDGEPDRYDIMYKFAACVWASADEFLEEWT